MKGSAMSFLVSEEYIFPYSVPSVPIHGSSHHFPVRRIFCVGRNYAAHAREMGFSDQDAPFFFTKPADAIVHSGATIPYPLLTQDLHHEIELVLAIGESGMNIDRDDAARHLFGAAVGIDLTRRDLQIAHREKGRPWCWGKSFDFSAPITAITQMRDLDDGFDALSQGRIWLSKNDMIKQDSDLDHMIWPVADIISFCSQAVELKPGDLIFTGTPEGVGPIERGDHLSGGIDGLGEINITFAHERADQFDLSKGQ